MPPRRQDAIQRDLKKEFVADLKKLSDGRNLGFLDADIFLKDLIRKWSS